MGSIEMMILGEEEGGRPLDSCPVIRSRDPEQVRDAVIQSYGASGFKLPHGAVGFKVRANHWQSPRIGLSYCSYGAPVQLAFPDSGFFKQQISLNRSAQVEVGKIVRRVTRDETFVIGPDRAIKADFGEGYEQLVLWVNQAALTNKLAALVGAPSARLSFDEAKVIQSTAVESMRRWLLFFAREVDSLIRAAGSPLAIAELEQAVIVSFICNNPNNYSAAVERVDPAPASWQLQRVKEYIEAHWSEALTIETLVCITGVSARSIFYHFRKRCGMSPMAFVKETRLKHARQMLISANTMDSVTEIALSCGFNNLGHFAKDYTSLFGERPSETMKRAKCTGARLS